MLETERELKEARAELAYWEEKERAFFCEEGLSSYHASIKSGELHNLVNRIGTANEKINTKQLSSLQRAFTPISFSK
ncbi:hypothetical protein Q3G72_009938 [Acer saccharum]|nr:hypothetical protein Q3G72_009938 [Acer saccharum]